MVLLGVFMVVGLTVICVLAIRLIEHTAIAVADGVARAVGEGARGVVAALTPESGEVPQPDDSVAVSAFEPPWAAWGEADESDAERIDPTYQTIPDPSPMDPRNRTVGVAPFRVDLTPEPGHGF